ncbi:MAG: aldolase [Acidobacteriia bacterium]|nr:aldolase [Terriglobia bacterium]
MHPDDQLMLRAPLPHRAEFYPLGFSVQISTNSPAVLRAAQASWGEWTRGFDVPPLDMRVLVHLDGPVPATAPVYRAQRHLFNIIADNANFGICDLKSGYCFSCVTPAVAEDSYFRNHLLETMAYLTIDHLYITILHAGCVARNGHGVLLCGDAGAGKSCLSYACMKRGWSLLSDDFSALVRGRHDRMIIGKPEHVRFRPEAMRLFPELTDLPHKVLENGKQMFDFQTGALPQARTARCCQAETILFLDRRESGDAELIPMDPQEALARIEFDRAYWDPPVFEEHRENIQGLLSRGVHYLRYSDFDGAIHILESLVS